MLVYAAYPYGAQSLVVATCLLLETSQLETSQQFTASTIQKRLIALQTVPAKLTRYGLSQVVNHLLALGADMATGREQSALAVLVLSSSSVDCT